MSIPFEQKYKIFLIYFSGTKWQNCTVHICTVSDTLHALQRPAPLRSARVGGLVLSAGRCSVSSVRACVCRCVAWSALHLARSALLPVMCRPSGCAVVLGSPPAGYIAAAQPRPVSLVTTEKIKKAQKITPPLFPISKIPRKNKKTPTKGLRSVLYLPYKP